ncbi:MAG: hypothetical protein M3283_03245 [Actinomycetota bacterium]|nr:hypothetical protein [Actinomycetota bacterium]
MLMPPTGTTIGFGVLPLEEFDFPAMPQIVRPPTIGIAERPQGESLLGNKDLVGDMADEGLGWSRGGSRSSGER